MEKALSSLFDSNREFIGLGAGVGYSAVEIAFICLIFNLDAELFFAVFMISSVSPCQLVWPDETR